MIRGNTGFGNRGSRGIGRNGDKWLALVLLLSPAQGCLVIFTARGQWWWIFLSPRFRNALVRPCRNTWRSLGHDLPADSEGEPLAVLAQGMAYGIDQPHLCLGGCLPGLLELLGT